MSSNRKRVRGGLLGALVIVLSFVGGAGCDGTEDVPDFSDVLNLPSTPYDYVGHPMPAHFQLAAVLAMDNTPANNATTNSGAALGRILFYDKSLSRNNTISCASCHLQEFGFSDPDALSEGFEGGLTRRNSTGIANAAFYARGSFFRDERAATLEDQVLMPIQDTVEMGMTLPEVVARVESKDYYRHFFADAFGSSEVTEERISRALAQFVRSILATNSKYDEGVAQVSDVKLSFPNYTAAENLGKQIFMGRGKCAACHMENPEAPAPIENVAIFFASPSNIGLDEAISSTDTGVAEVTGLDSDRGKFKTPSLRNVAVTGPYMYDGRMSTLEEVIDHYSDGVKMHPNLDERLIDGGGPLHLNLTPDEKLALVAFLETLTDRDMLTDVKLSNPFRRAQAQ